MIRYLSHKFGPTVPAYGAGGEKLDIRELKSQSRGDSSNVYWIGTANHRGTHVDCPAHFFTDGRKVVDYEPEFWFFHRPQVVAFEAEPGRIIRRADIEASVGMETDLLLIRSGWSRLRDSEKYCVEGPGLHPEVGLWLRRERPHVRTVGFDWISLSSFQNRELGREAHRAFLDPHGEGSPVLVIEDMFLPDEPDAPKHVLVAPWLIEGVDSAPCTIMGFYE